MAVVFNFVDKVLEVDGLEVDGVVEEDDVVAVAGQHLVDPRRVGGRQELEKGSHKFKILLLHITFFCMEESRNQIQSSQT